LIPEFIESSSALPEFQNGPLLRGKIDLRFDLLEGHYIHLADPIKKSYSIIEARLRDRS
jgi:hypothetical protein